MSRYGLFGKLQAQEGKGLELAAILLKAAALMNGVPGCLLYVVSLETAVPDTVRVMEVWESEADHGASLAVPGVRELIGQAVPILAAPPEGGLVLEVLGGNGLR